VRHDTRVVVVVVGTGDDVDVDASHRVFIDRVVVVGTVGTGAIIIIIVCALFSGPAPPIIEDYDDDQSICIFLFFWVRVIVVEIWKRG